MARHSDRFEGPGFKKIQEQVLALVGHTLN